MKKIFLYTLLVIIAGVGCRKKDNPRLPDFTRVPMPTITKDAGSALTISASAPNDFTGKFTVGLYFKNDIKPAKFDIVVVKNGDNSIVKTIQAGVTSYPASLTITGLQLATLFGSPIVVGDRFDIGADVTTQSGEKFEAFPAVGIGYGSGVGTQGGASTSIAYIAVCPFDINSFVGAATIKDPDFWGGNYPVTVSLESADTYKILGWVEEPTYYILVKVDAAALTVSVAKRVYGPTLPTTPYLTPAAEGTGTIDACKNQISMTLEETVSIGSFGSSVVTLVK